MAAEHLRQIEADTCAELSKLMHKKYASFLDGRKFEISNDVDGQEANVKVTLRSADESFYYPVEGRMDFAKEEMTVQEAQLFLIDYIDLYFQEFLCEENEDIYLPIDWADYTYEAIEFQLRGQILNKKIDKLADEWLSRGDSAVH